MPVPTTTIVAAALITEGDRILIAQRPKGKANAGKWEFPGGKAEPGEDPRRALERECLEELDIEVAAGPVYETIFHEQPTKNFLLIFYEVVILSGDPTPMESNEIAWVTVDELESIDLIESDLPLIRELRDRFPG